MDGYRLRLVPTSKFKTAYVQFRFSAPFRPETLNLRALLPYVLLAGSAAHPTKRRLNDAADRLYGATIGGGVAKAGMMSVVSLSLAVVNERFLPGGTSILGEALDLFAEVLFRPRFRLGVFRKGAVDSEIRLLKEDIEADYADKAEYSFQRMAEHMFKDELARFRPKGDYDTLDAVTPAALTDSYRDMIASDFVECTVVGAFDDDAIVGEIARRFAFGERAAAPRWIDTEAKPIASPETVVEKGDVSQARLQIGWRVPVRSGSDRYRAMLVANALFGDSDTSALFRIVRERERLCYYVYSVYAATKGALFVSAGVEPGREEAAVRLVAEVLAGIAAGTFAPEDLDLAKSAVIKRLRQSTDSIRGIVTDHSHFDRHYGRAYDLAENVAAIQGVTAADVAACAADAVLDTVYFLTKKGD